MRNKEVAMVLCRGAVFVSILFLAFQSESFVSAQSTASPSTDCGWPSIDEITCDYYGCCWTTINSSAIGCFNATNDTTTTMHPTTTALPTTTTILTTTAPLTTTLPTTTTRTTPMTTGPTTSIAATTSSLVASSALSMTLSATADSKSATTPITKIPQTTTPAPTMTTITLTGTRTLPAQPSTSTATIATGTPLDASAPSVSSASSHTMTLVDVSVSSGGISATTLGTDTGSPLSKSTKVSGASVVSTSGTTVSGGPSNESTNPSNPTVIPGQTNTGLKTSGSQATGPADQSTDISATHPTDASANQSTDALANQSTDASANQSTDASGGQPTGVPSGQPTDDSTGTSSSQSAGTLPNQVSADTSVPVQLTTDQDTTTAAPATTTHAPCVTQWTNHTNSFILGGTYYSQFSSSADTCLNACANSVIDCVAANVFTTQNATILCLLHTDPNDQTNMFVTSDASVYVIALRCTTLTTASQVTAPTENPNCRSMAWLNSTGTCCNGAMSYPDYKTVDDCLNACSCVVTGCIAAIVRNSTDGSAGTQCFLIMESSNLGDLWDCPSATQHTLLGSQNQVSTIYPTTQFPRTTMVQTTVGLVDYSICWHPVTIPNANVSLYKDVYGLVAIYTCNEGYVFTFGGQSRVNICKGNAWLIQIPGCMPVECDVSSYLTDPTYSGDASSFNSSQVLLTSCPVVGQERFIDGTQVESVKCTVTNGSNGVLLKPLSGCKNGRCWSPPLVTNTTAVYDVGTQTLYLTCIVGHRFEKGMTKQQFNCYTDGTWPYISACKAIFCPVLPTLINGSYSTDDVIYGTVVSANCDAGFVFPDHNNSKVFRCIVGPLGDDAEWDQPTTEQCQPVICTDPYPAVPGESTSSLSSSSQTIFHYLDSIQYDCVGGRKFSDGTKSKSVICAANAFWSVDEVSCDFNRCDPVPVVRNATPSSLKATMGNVVVYTCNLGFWFSRNVTQESTTCDGTNWSPVDKQCVPVTCLPLNVTNADVNATDNSYLATADIGCRPGYLFNGQSTVSINCTASGQWSASVTCDPIDCGQADDVTNAILQLSEIDTTFGYNATYYCIDGYWFSRETVTMTAVCDATGHWTVNGVAGANHWRSCTAITCLPLFDYVVNTTNFGLGSAVNVSCPVGYRFPSSKMVDLESVCKNIGTWTPDIPDCISNGSAGSQKAPVFEAKDSGVIAGVAISFVVIGLLVVLFFDSGRLMAAFTLFGKNARGSCASSSPSS